MIRRPPRSTLFPYTSSSDLPGVADAQCRGSRRGGGAARNELRGRSEEHTSELQSLTNLVCRLLLEKKNEQKLVNQELAGILEVCELERIEDDAAVRLEEHVV